MRWPGHIKPGTKIGQPLDGVDMRPALRECRPIERDVFYLRDDNASLRRGDWKYLRIDGKELLFNLTDDVGEQPNVAAAHPAKLAELKAAHAAVARTLA